MPDVDDVVRALLFQSRADGTETRRLPDAHVARLSAGRFHLDLDDADHVFLLTVEQVARRRPPVRPVPLGPVEGVDVAFMQVVVDNYVHVHLAGLPGARRTQLAEEHEQAFARWAAQRAQGPSGPPPRQPGDLLMEVGVELADDLGTTYALSAAESGGSGTEWLAVLSFEPAPPPTARLLHVTLRPPGRDEVAVRVGL